MYEWAPSLSAAWRRLLDWVTTRAGADLEIITGGAISLDELWSRPDMGCVVMCGYPFALRANRPALLAAPVPSHPRYGGRAVYVSDFIVRADSSFARLEDTFGGRIGYSTEHSHSGYNAPRHHLLRYRGPDRARLFEEVKGPYVRQRAVVQAVLDGDVDVAAIDGYAHELLRRHDPAAGERLRVVAVTEPAPSPPFVASAGMDIAARERLTAALVAAHEAGELKPVMDDLLLSRFERVAESDFDVFLDWQRRAESAGYSRLG
jgi:ABC-type phosphate/phosphonate transport system substrate-binding protein